MVTFACIDEILLQLGSQSAWTGWSELEGGFRGKTVPEVPGLYRLQLMASNLQEVVYIGQSGDLHKRMSMLNGIFAELMPYRSPHVAGVFGRDGWAHPQIKCACLLGQRLSFVIDSS